MALGLSKITRRDACHICGVSLFLILILLATPPAGAVEVVENPEQPPQHETWQMKELWRVGGDDDADLLIGLVSDVKSDKVGNIYILDSQMCHVNVLSPKGEFIRTLSRKGEGPGEVNLPSSILMMGDNEIGIVQGYPSKVIRVTTEDVPKGSIVVGDCGAGDQGIRITMNAAYEAGRLLVLGAKMSFVDGERKNTLYLASFADTGCETHLFAEMEEQNNLGNDVWRIKERQNYFPATRWTLGEGGRLFTSPNRDEYVIKELGPQGEVLREIRREFTARKRTAEDYDRIKSGYSSNVPNLKYEFDLEPLEPAITGLDGQADGSLWVYNCYSNSELPEGIARRFDRFDSSGHLVSEVLLAMPFDSDDDELYRLDDTHFARVTGLRSARAADSRAQGFSSGGESGKGDDAAPVEVVVYERVE
jgi:6-bladed beta-propeller